MALLAGLILTLAMVAAYSWYLSRQITGLQRLQSELADRNRRDSLQLLRIQNDLNQLALAMRDMLDRTTPYPLTAWSSQFDRIRGDLDDALTQQAGVSLARRTPEQASYLVASVEQFWRAVDQVFRLAAAGQEDEARQQIQLSLQARQAALSTAVARLLVQNNASEAETAAQVQQIYGRVQRQLYVFLTAVLLAIAATSLYLIRVNRRVFAELAALSNDRRDLARQMITTREATLREVARELHDELGQLLTAIGSMLGRAGRLAAATPDVQTELHDISVVSQSALENVRGLSQSLHPSLLEELGLASAVEAHLANCERQLGLRITFEQSGSPVPVDAAVGIHVYRVLQEALTNVARHSGVTEAHVRLAYDPGAVELSVENHGGGFRRSPGRRGVGLVAMQERAALVGGTLDIHAIPGGGTRVRLRVPLTGATPAS